MTSAFGDIQLLASERNAFKVMWAQLSRKYLTMPDTLNNLGSFAREAEDRAAALGFIVAVDFDPVQLEDGTIVTSPTVSVVSRIAKEEFDHQKMQQEVVSGEADGVVGVVDPGTGTLHEPAKSF